MAKPEKKGNRILLIASRQIDRSAAMGLFRATGYQLMEPAAGQPAKDEPDVILVILDHDHPHTDMLPGLRQEGSYSPPVVVFGPPRGKKWRRAALGAGAFACLSGNAPRDDKIGMVAAASRYRASQLENQFIRQETDIVVQGLLESFGSEAQKVKRVVKEAENVRESLEEVQNRIIRSML